MGGVKSFPPFHIFFSFGPLFHRLHSPHTCMYRRTFLLIMLARIARRMVPLRGQSAMTATTTMKFCQSASLGGVSATMASLLPFVPSPETGKRAGGIIIPTAKGRPIAQNYSTGSRNARYSVMLSSPSLSSTALPRFGVNSVGVGHNSPARQARGCAAVGASLNQIRYVWQEVIRQVPSDDPNRVGKLTFEDVDLADTRMARAIRAEGEILSWGVRIILFLRWRLKA